MIRIIPFQALNLTICNWRKLLLMAYGSYHVNVYLRDHHSLSLHWSGHSVVDNNRKLTRVGDVCPLYMQIQKNGVSSCQALKLEGFCPTLGVQRSDFNKNT
jgi:hypothetical protein